MFGACAIRQLLDVASWPLPSAQLDKPAMPCPQQSADAVLYAAAAAVGTTHQNVLGDFWARAAHPLAELYRLVMARQFGRHRRTQVLPTGARGVAGGCIGLRQSVSWQPFCSDATDDNGSDVGEGKDDAQTSSLSGGISRRKQRSSFLEAQASSICGSPLVGDTQAPWLYANLSSSEGIVY